MATTKFNTMHLRFASSIRDEVATADVAGKDVSVADRSAYLNYAWGRYVTQLYRSYEDRLGDLKSAIQSLLKTTIVNCSGPGIITVLPGDYGLFIDLAYNSGSGYGIPINNTTQEEWTSILTNVNPEVAASSTQMYCNPSDVDILLLPATFQQNGLVLSYILKPFDVVVVTGVGGTDIPLDVPHLNSIVDFALFSFYKDKQEFDVAKMFLEDAYESAPFPLKRDPNLEQYSQPAAGV